MSHFDPDKYIPYERLADNLKVVRDRSALLSLTNLCAASDGVWCIQVAATFDLVRESPVQSFG